MDDASLNGLSGVEREELFRMLPVEATRQAALFPQSVASGDPRVDGAVLWTRVEPTALTGTAPEGAMVGWQICFGRGVYGLVSARCRGGEAFGGNRLYGEGCGGERGVAAVYALLLTGSSTGRW